MFEGFDVNKTNGSRECIICYYWYFLEINFRFQSKVYDVLHDLIQKAMSFNDVAIVSAKGNYDIHFWYMTKDETIDHKKILNWLKKGNIIKQKNLLSRIKDE